MEVRAEDEAFITVLASPNASEAPNPAYVVAPLIDALSAAYAGPGGNTTAAHTLRAHSGLR